jgi:hypothetical protein
VARNSHRSTDTAYGIYYKSNRSLRRSCGQSYAFRGACQISCSTSRSQKPDMTGQAEHGATLVTSEARHAAPCETTFIVNGCITSPPYRCLIPFSLSNMQVDRNPAVNDASRPSTARSWKYNACRRRDPRPPAVRDPSAGLASPDPLPPKA